MAAYATDNERLDATEAELRSAMVRYTRLMWKADADSLRGEELDQLLLSAVRMQRNARALGLNRRQLGQMLHRLECMRAAAATQ